jgi:beta-galactosidase
MSMKVAKPADTYMDTRALHKGTIWVNGRPLGRFWSVGPQFALYTPAPWLHQGENDVVLFDLLGTHEDLLKSGAEPIFDMPAAGKSTAREAK